MNQAKIKVYVEKALFVCHRMAGLVYEHNSKEADSLASLFEYS